MLEYLCIDNEFVKLYSMSNFYYGIKSFLFTAAALLIVAFTSCEKEEQKQHDPFSDEDQTEVIAYDGLEWFQGSLVVVNDKNEVIRRLYGKVLDLSSPDVISIPVNDLADAESLFRSWIAPGKNVSKVEGGYDYTPTDADGKAQGEVTFRTGGESGIKATVTVSVNTGISPVSVINFISYDYWPENDEVGKYEAGMTYLLEGEFFSWITRSNVLSVDVKVKELEFYCIQGNDNGQEAILVWLSPDYNENYVFGPNTDDVFASPNCYIETELYQKLPTIGQAQKVLDFYNANSEVWSAMLKEMDGKGYQWSAKPGGLSTTGNSEFLLNSYDSDNDKIKCLDLDGTKGKICNVYGWSWFNYRYMHIRIFPPYFNR